MTPFARTAGGSGCTSPVAGARALARLALRKPEAPYATGQTIRQLAGDTAEDLEGTNCSPRLVVELERGL
jgi:hypothetical protein